MAVRICTLGVPGFRHDGLVVGERWTPFDPEPEQRDSAIKTLRDYHGRFIRVHAEDIDRLPDELGLKFVDADQPLVETKKPGKADDKKPGKADDKKPSTSNDAPTSAKKD